MNSEIRDCIVVDGEAGGLGAALSLARARRLTLIGTLMRMDINERHAAVVAGGATHSAGVA